MAQSASIARPVRRRLVLPADEWQQQPAVMPATPQNSLAKEPSPLQADVWVLANDVSRTLHVEDDADDADKDSMDWVHHHSFVSSASKNT